MKKLLVSLIPVAIFAAMTLVSCREDNPTVVVEPNFPTAFTAFVEPGETYDFTVSPNMDWTVSIPSDATTSAYFRILDGSQQTYSVRGEAGDATITIVCIADEKDFDNHSVEISMTMDSRTETIGTLTLSANERTLEVYPALSENGSLVPSTDGTFLYGYSETPLAKNGNGTVEMYWNSETSSYVGSILVDANFAWTASATDGLVMTNGATSLTATEVALSCGFVAEDTDYEISLGLEGSEYYYTYKVHVPAFVPEFAAYPVLTDEYGFVPSDEDSQYRMSYSESPLSGEVALQWFEGTTGYMSYILVDANYDYVDVTADDYAGKPSWLDIELLTTDGTTCEYRLTVDESNYSLDPVSGDIVFSMAGAESVSNSFTVSMDGVRGYIDASGIAFGSTIRFNAAGQYYHDMMGDYMDGAKTGTITSAEDIVLVPLSYDRGYYNEDVYGWMNATIESEPSSSVLKTSTVSISVGAASSSRSGVVYALPQSVYDAVKEAADRIGGGVEFVLNPDTDVLDYTEYILCYIEQEGEGGSSDSSLTFSLNMSSQWYEMNGNISFEDISSDFEDDDVLIYPEVVMNGGKIYRLTYNNFISDPIMFDYTGTIPALMVNPWTCDWLGYEYGDGMLALMPYDQASSAGNKAYVAIYDADWNISVVIVVYCNY